mgnify:CR=1 FL=1
MGLRKGETFAIAADSMAEAGVIPGWTDRKCYIRATNALLSVGLIRRTSYDVPVIESLESVPVRHTTVWQVSR